jgi:beta-lactamase class A
MQLIAATNSPMVNSPMNKEQTWRRRLRILFRIIPGRCRGSSSRTKKRSEYRRILSLGDAIWLLPLPLGGSAFCKRGSIDVPGFQAVRAPGGMVFEDRWVYFAFIINWQAAAVTDPQTVAAFVKAAGQAMTIVKDALATT